MNVNVVCAPILLRVTSLALEKLHDTQFLWNNHQAYRCNWLLLNYTMINTNSRECTVGMKLCFLFVLRFRFQHKRFETKNYYITNTNDAILPKHLAESSHVCWDQSPVCTSLKTVIAKRSSCVHYTVATTTWGDCLSQLGIYLPFIILATTMGSHPGYQWMQVLQVGIKMPRTYLKFNNSLNFTWV